MLSFLRSIFNHKHQWAVIADSYFETDAGVGMAPIKHCQLKCEKCASIATKTDHPMYGSKITEVQSELNFYGSSVAYKIQPASVIYQSFENSFTQ